MKQYQLSAHCLHISITRGGQKVIEIPNLQITSLRRRDIELVQQDNDVGKKTYKKMGGDKKGTGDGGVPVGVLKIPSKLMSQIITTYTMMDSGPNFSLKLNHEIKNYNDCLTGKAESYKAQRQLQLQQR